MRWRRARWVAATVLVALVVAGGVGAVGIAGARAEVYTRRGPGAPPTQVDAVAAPTHDPDKPTAVIVLGPEGANAADVLAPYEVLAATGAFNLYTVAPQRQPVPLTGNLDLVPDLSLEQLDQRLPTGPEVIVVPQLSEVAAGLPASLAPVIAWLQRQRTQGDPLLVGVCVGAQVLAEAGLLEGRPVTSHWLGLIELRRDYPQLDWQDGVTYIDDGDLITTAGVLSGVNGALRVIESLLGPAAAAQAARAVAWPAYDPGRADPAIPAGTGGCGGVALSRLPVGPPHHRGAAHRRGWGDRAGVGVPALHRAVVSGPPAGGDHRRPADPLPARPGVRAPRDPGHRGARAGPAAGARRRRGPTGGRRRAGAARGAGPGLSPPPARVCLRRRPG